jgi:hypothetical protein
MRAWVFVCLLASATAHAQDTRLVAALRSRAIADDDFARRDLYTWTSRSQAQRIHRERSVLLSDAGEGAVRAPYQQALDRLTRGEDATIARLLTEHPALARRRYAWTTPYGTVVPRGDRSYGPVLVHIRLRGDAWIARFDPSERPAFRIVDGAGRRVSMREVIDRPERLAAVVHVNDVSPRGPFREIIVHNEAQIARVAIGTRELDARIEDDIRTLRRVRAMPPRFLPFWRHLGAEPRALFAATMPFDTPRHHDVRTILRALRATPVRTAPIRFTPE